MRSWEKERINKIGSTVEEEFANLMTGFPSWSEQFKDTARRFFGCGAMSALTLAVKRMNEHIQNGQPEKLGEELATLADEIKAFTNR